MTLSNSPAASRPARSPKVFWTNKERHQIATFVEQLTFETLGMSKLIAVTRAQEVALVPERRRKISSWAMVAKQLQPFIEEARNSRKLREATLALAKQPPKVAVPPEKTEAEKRLDKVDAWLGLTAELAAPLLLHLLKIPAVQQELQNFFSRSWASPERGTPDPMAATFSTHHPDTLTPRPRYLVAGLLPAQACVIEKALSEKIEFRFWNTDESKDKLKTLAKTCHVAVGVTNFISHGADASMKANAPKYVRHCGGVSRLKDTIQVEFDATSRREASASH